MRVLRGLRLGTAIAATAAVVLSGLGSLPAGAENVVAVADDGPTDSLVAWYKLNETSGTVAADSSGNNRNGTVVGSGTTPAATPAWNAGDGYNFAGGTNSGGQAIALPNNLVTGLSEVSIDFDVLVDPTLSGNWFMYNIGNTATYPNGTGYIFTTGAATFRGTFASAGFTTEQSVQKTTALATNTWKHVTYTIKGGSVATPGAAYLYEDGVLVSSNTALTITPSQIATSTRNFIGRSAYPNDLSFKGKIRDFRIYSRVLTAAESATLATDAVTPGLTADVAALTLGDTSAVTANLTLPTTVGGSTVTWSSANAGVVSNAGVITRPAGADADVVLTATVTRGALSQTKPFTIHVVQGLSAQARVDAAAAAISVPNVGDARGSLTLPAAGAEGTVITWSSSNAGVITGTGEVTRPAAGAQPVTVTLTATVTYAGASATRVLTATVPALPAAQARTAYFFPHFTGETENGEKIYFAASKGNDALHWNSLNNGAPVLTSTYGEQGLRDPFIMRSPEGDKFYMIATDLKVYPGTNFARAQQSGSTYIEVWESTDLVNWSDQRHVKVSTDFAGNTWAPESYYDEASQSYVVYWASNIYPTTTVAGRSYTTVYNQMTYATTRDFVTFSPAQPWINVKRGTGLGLIDSTVIKEGNTFYRFTKDEASMTIRQEKSTDLLATVTGTLPTTTTTPGWQLIKAGVAGGLANAWGGTFNQGEGPTIFKANPGDVTVTGNDPTWYLFIDQPSYHGGQGYTPFKTTDLNSGTWTSSGPGSALPASPRHGTVLPITQTEYDALLNKYQKNLLVSSAAAITVSTPAGQAPVLPATAAVTYADGSTASVPVTWATVAPASYAAAGQFTVQGTLGNGVTVKATATVTVTAVQVVSSVSITVDPTAVPVGTAGTATVTVTSTGSPTGTVTVKNGTTVVGTGSLANGTATVTLSQLPVGDHELIATYAGDESTLPSTSAMTTLRVHFLDVLPTRSFFDDIQWMATEGLSAGFSGGNFRPSIGVSRDALIRFIYAASHDGAAAPSCATKPFTDVPVTQQFCGEIAWAATAGIAGGYSDGSFRPSETVSRQATAAFLYRAKNPGQTPTACTTAPFTDVRTTADFCGEIAWAAAQNIVRGYEGGDFRPGVAVNRDAVAAFVHRAFGG